MGKVVNIEEFAETAALKLHEHFSPVSFDGSEKWKKYVNTKVCDAIDDIFGKLSIAMRHKILVKFEELSLTNN